jgi:hypothetical protein
MATNKKIFLLIIKVLITLLPFVWSRTCKLSCLASAKFFLIICAQILLYMKVLDSTAEIDQIGLRTKPVAIAISLSVFWPETAPLTM